MKIPMTPRRPQQNRLAVVDAAPAARRSADNRPASQSERDRVERARWQTSEEM